VESRLKENIEDVAHLKFLVRMKEDGLKNLTYPDKYYMSDNESDKEKKCKNESALPQKSSMAQKRHDLKTKFGICSGMTRQESR